MDELEEEARSIAEQLFDDGYTLAEISQIGLEIYHKSEEQRWKHLSEFDLNEWESEDSH